MKLGRFFNTDVKLDFSSFIIAFAVIHGFYNYAAGIFPGTNALLLLVTSVLVSAGFLFSILFHEFAHVLTGHKFGVGCRGITLHGLGGSAYLNKNPPTSTSEFWIAIAGPLSSLVLSVPFLLLGAVSHVALGDGLFSRAAGVLASVNLVICIFNLIPAFPLDGGRVFRAISWKFTKDYIKSTRISVAVSKGFVFSLALCGVLMMAGMSLPFFGSGTFGGVWLIVISAFVYMAGNAELEQMYMRR